MKYIVLIFFIIGCSSTTEVKKTTSTEHIQKSQQLTNIMHKFNNLIFQDFQSELQKDNKRIEYTKRISSLLDELIINSKELQRTQQNQSNEFIHLANELESESEILKKTIMDYDIEKIEPKLQDITNICNKCHATIQ